MDAPPLGNVDFRRLHRLSTCPRDAAALLKQLLAPQGLLSALVDPRLAGLSGIAGATSAASELVRVAVYHRGQHHSSGGWCPFSPHTLQCDFVIVCIVIFAFICFERLALWSSLVVML